MIYCVFVFFFFNDTATTEIYTLSLHDALPILGARRAGVDLVVHKVQQLEDVHVADGDPAVERLAGPAIVQSDFAAAAHADICAAVAAYLLYRLVDVIDLGAREDGGRDEDRLAAVLAQALARGPPEVGLEDLADVHPARHAEGAQDHIHG